MLEIHLDMVLGNPLPVPLLELWTEWSPEVPASLGHSGREERTPLGNKPCLVWEGGSLPCAWEVTREVLEATVGCDEDVSDPHFCTMERLLLPALSKPFCEAFSHAQCTSGGQSPALIHAVALQGHSELIILLLPPH